MVRIAAHGGQARLEALSATLKLAERVVFRVRWDGRWGPAARESLLEAVAGPRVQQPGPTVAV